MLSRGVLQGGEGPILVGLLAQSSGATQDRDAWVDEDTWPWERCERVHKEPPTCCSLFTSCHGKGALNHYRPDINSNKAFVHGPVELGLPCYLPPHI